METVTTATDATAYGPVLDALLRVWEHLNGWALLIALATPVLIIYGRQEIRIKRIRQIFDFENTFQRIDPDPDRPINPSFEFVRSKYLSDIDAEGLLSSQNRQPPTASQLEELFVRITRRGRRQDIGMLVSSLGLIVLIYFGFEALFIAIKCGFAEVSCACTQTFLTSCPAPVAAATKTSATYGDLILIGGLTFAGAYVETIRSLLRNLAIFDLSSYTFLRQTGEMVAAVVFAMIAYAAIPDPLNPFYATTENDGISRTWIALAPILGLMPRSATQFVFTKTKNLITWFKTEDDRFQKVTRVTTIDAIDGIDFPTRFRLEICGIFDVQNLATANPIMLHIESPFGIYQCIDWVAQAQLCHILGLEKFLMMRELNIRSIFDLERAIDSELGPDAIDIIYAGILFAGTDNLRSISQISSIKPIIIEDDKVTIATVDDYCVWARKVAGTDPVNAKECVEHIMRWIGDDLHVRRLRAIWNDISDSLGKDSWALADSQSYRNRRGRTGRGAAPANSVSGQQPAPQGSASTEADAAVSNGASSDDAGQGGPDSNRAEADVGETGMAPEADKDIDDKSQ